MFISVYSYTDGNDYKVYVCMSVPIAFGIIILYMYNNIQELKSKLRTSQSTFS